MRSSVAVFLACLPLAGQESRQATGVRVGEVTPDSAIVWMRVTAAATRNREGIVRRGKVAPLAAEVQVEQLEGAAPGAPGQVRLRYGARQDLQGARTTPWAEVAAARDYTHQFHLTGLKPATGYYYAAGSAGPGGQPVHAPLRGSFQTAPPPTQYADVAFTVVTGHMYQDMDHPEGFHIYEAMLKLGPQFIVPTGDNVYYDSEDPRATTWGSEQKKWLLESLLASDADFKVLVSPTPIVGPDRTNKADNHSNAAFAHEGNEFRRWAQKNVPDNFFIACGDRHWQYHSVDPETGVQEFSAGPASDQHAAGSPGYNPRYHKFHLVKGGFLSVSFRRAAAQSRLDLSLHDVDGKIVYEHAGRH